MLKEARLFYSIAIIILISASKLNPYGVESFKDFNNIEVYQRHCF